jgi:transcriptional regulator with XRE-family HTH domain
MMTQEKYDEITVKRALYRAKLLRDRNERDRVRTLRVAHNFRDQVDYQLEKKEWTHEDLGTALNMKRSRVTYILSEKANVTVKTLNKIALALDCSLDIRLTTFQGQQDNRPTGPILSFEEGG